MIYYVFQLIWIGQMPDQEKYIIQDLFKCDVGEPIQGTEIESIYYFYVWTLEQAEGCESYLKHLSKNHHHFRSYKIDVREKKKLVA